MTSRSRFCQGCNEKILLEDEQDVCPHCGQTMAMVDDAPTLAFTNLHERGTYLPNMREADTRALELIGKPFAHYRMDRLLGRGGMAWVFLAQHTTLLRPCAVKILNRPVSGSNDEYVAMFLAEARAAASLVHPHVVAIHTLGEEHGWHYIEMEYVPGESLQSRIESRDVSPIEATEMMVQIASALAEAHRLGLVHRDIKPANVLVSQSNVAKLADFGLAKRVAQAQSRDNALAGTPYYMAPELFAGHAADPRSDIYAMGVTFYFLLTRRLPFVGRSVAQLSALHARQPIPDPRTVRDDAPDESNRVINRCLAKEPAERYAEGTELLHDLRSLFGGLRSLESLLRLALDGLKVELSGSGDRFEVEVPLTGGRRQTVKVESGSGGPQSEKLVRIYSRCGPANEAFMRRALELNATIPHGAIAWETIQGQHQFVMGNTYPRATCDPEEIRKSVLTIARHADDIENQLTGRDEH